MMHQILITLLYITQALVDSQVFRKCVVSFVNEESFGKVSTNRQLLNFYYRFQIIKTKYTNELSKGNFEPFARIARKRSNKKSCKLNLTGEKFDYCKIWKLKNLDDEVSRYTIFQYLQTIVNYLDFTKQKNYFIEEDGEIIENLDSLFQQELYNVCNLVSDISLHKKPGGKNINNMFLSMKNVKNYCKRKNKLYFTLKFFEELFFLFDKLDDSLRKIITS